MRWVEQERDVRETTLREYRTSAEKHLIPTFGSLRIEAVSTRAIERWRSRLIAEGRLSARTINKLTAMLNGIFRRARRVWGLQQDPVADIDKLRERYDPGAYDFYSPEEVQALIRAADNETDAAIFLAAAFAGLRMGEILGLRWRGGGSAGVDATAVGRAARGATRQGRSA